jgi:competence ComEA-like helix-hairpin-helix protein
MKNQEVESIHLIAGAGKGKQVLVLFLFAAALILIDLYRPVRNREVYTYYLAHDEQSDRFQLQAVTEGQWIDAPEAAEGDRIVAGRNWSQLPPTLALFFRQPMSINTATVEDLEMLPGIGPRLAAAIVEHRDLHGSFTGPSDLEAVPGLGRRSVAKLMPLISFSRQVP